MCPNGEGVVMVMDEGRPSRVALGPGRTAPYLASYLGLERSSD